MLGGGVLVDVDVLVVEGFFVQVVVVGGGGSLFGRLVLVVGVEEGGGEEAVPDCGLVVGVRLFLVVVVVVVSTTPSLGRVGVLVEVEEEIGGFRLGTEFLD